MPHRIHTHTHTPKIDWWSRAQPRSYDSTTLGADNKYNYHRVARALPRDRTAFACSVCACEAVKVFDHVCVCVGFVRTREKFDWSAAHISSCRFGPAAGRVKRNRAIRSHRRDEEVVLAFSHAWMCSRMKLARGAIDCLRAQCVWSANKQYVVRVCRVHRKSHQIYRGDVLMMWLSHIRWW